MKLLVFLFCIVITLRFVYNFSHLKDWKSFLSVFVDAFIIISFAILERGRF